MSSSCLVTGATGYVGGRLVPQLLAAGHRVRVLARHPEKLRDIPWVADVEVVTGDAGDAASVRAAMAGMDVAYYLLHSLQEGPQLEAAERGIATTFADAARDSGLRRIVYLGGLAPRIPASSMSAHMRSRVEVGNALRASGVPTAELRAAVIIGSGSASFEMLRYLTERLPAMITPRWVRSQTQPIAIRDVLRYLVGAIDLPDDVSRTFDIGGPEVLTYQEMMQRYAKVAGLRPRVILPINLLTPNLSSHWVNVVTPVPKAIARPLVLSLRHPSVCREHDIAAWIPDPPGGLISFDEAVRLALTRIQDAEVVTRWSGASVAGAPSDPLPSDPDWAGGSLLEDVRELRTTASPEQVWSALERIGGENGWYSSDFLWQVRGMIDRMIGGVGLRRGRRDPSVLVVGDVVDFWRVEERIAPRLLRLRAEMKNPGLAWLEFTIEPEGTGSRLRQRAVFYPRGLAGQAYWWSVAPFHAFVFPPMIKHLVERAESMTPPPKKPAATPADLELQRTSGGENRAEAQGRALELSPYERFGGAPFFSSLVASFYSRVSLDPVLRPMYPDGDLGPAERRLTMFLEQYWGGPHTYDDERGHPRLRMRHAPYPIDSVARDRWLMHMHDAMVEQDMAESDEQVLWQYLVSAAFSMQNVPDEPPGHGIDITEVRP